ncbi:MAG: hypothetical protein EXS46_03035 [Candidatus Taylorbacteria bacterium]|nr:hypothetical protein [Candidatus Taylorbacteria bacterium]
MSKKTAYIIIIIFVLVLAGGFLAFFFYTNRGQGNNIIVPAEKINIFPASPTPSAEKNSPNDKPNEDDKTSQIDDTSKAILKELSMRPSAGGVALATSTSRGVTVRFLDKGDGKVYDVNTDDNEEIRVSNTTIAKTVEAIWNKDGTKVIARHIGDDPDSIKTYSASLIAKNADQTSGTLQGSYLSDNIKMLTASPDKNKIFYQLVGSGGSTGIISDFDGTKKTGLMDSPLGELLLDWSNASTIALTTKPAAGIPGFLFFLNSKTGATTRVISRIEGLTTLVSPSASEILYSESGQNGFYLKVYSTKTGSAVDTAIATLPEKCIWSKTNSSIIYCSVPSYLPDTGLPDSWYKGLISFSDDIWKIDASTGAGEIIAKLKDTSGKNIDGVNLMLSQNEDYLFFTNKKDYHLWSLKLRE